MTRKKNQIKKKAPPYATMKDKPNSYLKGNKLVGEDISLGDVHRTGNMIDQQLNQLDSSEESGQVEENLHELFYEFLDQVRQDEFMKDDPQVRDLIKQGVENHIISPMDAREVLGENKRDYEYRLVESLYNQFYSYLKMFNQENNKSIKNYYKKQILESMENVVFEIKNNPRLLKFNKSRKLLEDIGYSLNRR